MKVHPKKELEVWQSCDSLLKTGEAITYKNIADTLEKFNYKRGSYSDIKKYLDSWRKQQAAKSTISINSDDADDELTKSIYSIRQVIHKEASEKVEKITKRAEKQVAAANEQLIHTKQILEQVSTERDNLKKLYTELQSQHEALHHTCNVATNSTNYLEGEIAELKLAQQQAIASNEQQLAAQADKHEVAIQNIHKLYAKQIDSLMLQLDEKRLAYDKIQVAKISQQSKLAAKEELLNDTIQKQYEILKTQQDNIQTSLISNELKIQDLLQIIKNLQRQYQKANNTKQHLLRLLNNKKVKKKNYVRATSNLDKI